MSTGGLEDGDSLIPSGFFGDSNTGTNSPDNATSSSFANFIEQLLIKESTQHRQTILITSAFSIAASILVICVILYDACSFQRSHLMLRDGKIRTKQSIWTSLHSAEVFALAVAVAAVIQSAIFIGVQSTTLGSQWATECALTAQLVWPASWLVAFTILVFSLEVMCRSFGRTRFHARGTWTVPACVAAIVSAMFGLWLAAYLSKSVDMCWGSLLWWTLHYGQPSLVLTVGMVLTNLVTAAILAIQLVKTVQIDKSERIAATRVVYALGVNVIVLTFILPFWITVVARNINRTASEVADILVTLNGLLQAVLHLLLRVNSERLAIRPRETPWTGKRKIRLLGPNDVNIHEFISSPLLLQRDSSGSRWSRAIKETDVQKINLARQLQSQPLTPPITPQQPTAALSPRANAQPSPMPRPLVSAVTRRPSNTQYSLFPTEASGRLPVESWVTEFSTESEETIEPPAPLFTSRHGRNSSTQTSETVEFALRLSHRAADMLSPIAPTPVEPVSHSRLGLGDSMLSPMRYVRPSSPNRPAMTTDTEAIPSQATRVAFERPKVTPTLSTLKLQRPKRTTSLRNSFAVMGSQRRREVDKSLPPLPRNSAVDAPVAEAPKAPNWRDSSRKHKPENAFPQRVPFEFPSPVEELWPAQKPPEWI